MLKCFRFGCVPRLQVGIFILRLPAAAAATENRDRRADPGRMGAMPHPLLFQAIRRVFETWYCLDLRHRVRHDSYCGVARIDWLE
jgi:hypothetical protein